jgi:hypothetical protein
MLIDDGYSERHGEYLIRRLVKSERMILQRLLQERRTWEAEKFLFKSGRVTSIIGEEVIPEESEKQALAEALVTWPTEEAELLNLRQSVALLLKTPLLGLRSCEMCKRWWFDPDTNKIVRVGTADLLRPPHAPVPCDTDAGCLKGHWSNPLEMSPKNRKAWNHWLEWKYVGCPDPHDAILRRNWRWFEALAAHYGLGKNSRTARK